MLRLPWLKIESMAWSCKCRLLVQKSTNCAWRLRLTGKGEDLVGIDAMTAIRVPGTEVAPAAVDRPVATVTVVIVEITAVGIVESVMIGTDVASPIVTTVAPLPARRKAKVATKTVTGSIGEKTTEGRAARLTTSPVTMRWMRKS